MDEQATLYDQIRGDVQRLIEKCRESATDGITIAEGMRLVVLFGASVHRLVHAIPGHSAEEKQAAILEAVDRFYAEVLAPADLPGVPDFVERSIVDPALGSVLHHVASGLLLGLEEVLAQGDA